MFRLERFLLAVCVGSPTPCIGVVRVHKDRVNVEYRVAKGKTRLRT